MATYTALCTWPQPPFPYTGAYPEASVPSRMTQTLATEKTPAPTAANRGGKRGSLALVVAAGALVLSMSLGIRQTFGLFIGPIAADHLVTVGFLSFAIALQNLMWGLAQPFAGALTDRFGPAPVVAGGAVLYGAGLLAVVHQPDALAVVVGFGLLVGIGQSATTFAVVIA
ncbi:MAG: hypothetical protein QOD51_2756 [Candidatus Eremiobacteraeota bacterium]|nr:hypothetical protein [Candidatus Eremiobacteraeota bacterium]